MKNHWNEHTPDAKSTEKNKMKYWPERRQRQVAEPVLRMPDQAIAMIFPLTFTTLNCIHERVWHDEAWSTFLQHRQSIIHTRYTRELVTLLRRCVESAFISIQFDVFFFGLPRRKIIYTQNVINPSARVPCAAIIFGSWILKTLECCSLQIQRCSWHVSIRPTNEPTK